MGYLGKPSWIDRLTIKNGFCMAPIGGIQHYLSGRGLKDDFKFEVGKERIFRYCNYYNSQHYQHKVVYGNKKRCLQQQKKDCYCCELRPGNRHGSCFADRHYPSSYFDTVSVASKEMNRRKLPELVDMLENMDAYDTVFLVFPLWWNTMPKPVEAFLNNYDFSGKSVIPVVTHGGSGAGRSIEDIKDVCGGTVMENPLEIYCGDILYCRELVTEWLKGL